MKALKTMIFNAFIIAATFLKICMHVVKVFLLHFCIISFVSFDPKKMSNFIEKEFFRSFEYGKIFNF